MKKQVILSILRNLKVARFNENVKYCFLGSFLGTLIFQDDIFGVYLFRDSVCQYICLEHTMNNVKDIEDAIESIKERVLVGRYIIKDTNIILQSFFPILEKDFVEQQINNSIWVIERMINICNICKH